MSAPPGFNPNASLLPDPGASAAPIQVMKGGGSSSTQKGGAGVFNDAEMAALAKYQLHSGGVIATQFNDEQKREFLNQIADKSRCRRTTGDSVILGKDCWAVVKVIRALLNAKIKKGNLETPTPVAEPSPTPSDPDQQPSVSDVAGSDAGAPSPNTNSNSNSNSNLSNENVTNLHNFLEEGAENQKPSPCKNRKKTQRNVTNTNTNSVGTINEQNRIAANVAASTASSGKSSLKRSNGKRNLINTRKKKKSVKLLTTAGPKAPTNERGDEKNIAFTEGTVNSGVNRSSGQVSPLTLNEELESLKITNEKAALKKAKNLEAELAAENST